MFLRSGKSNMEYNVKLTEEFLGDIEEICDYEL